MNSLNIKKNDNVKVITGKDKGKTGKVLRVLSKDGMVIVEGMNVKKKHSKPKKQGQKGQIIEKAMPLNISNIMIVCPACSKITKVGKKISGEKRVRVCKKCGAELQ